jgi:hypothetical protein
LVHQEAFVRFFLFFSLPLALAAQSAGSDQQLTQALITEIQQLRMAIERSTLLNARTQLAISQLQLQEQSVTRLTSQLNDVRTQSLGASALRQGATERIKDLEQRRTTTTDPKMVQQIEMELKEMKFHLEQGLAAETNRATRESELSVQLQQAQSHISATRSRIDEMERALDAAIHQMLKRP